MIIEYADLEIGLHRREARSYTVEFRFSQPDSEADVRVGQGLPALVDIDLDELNRLAHSPSAYGEKLTEGFFGNAAVQSAFAQALASSQSLGTPLRIRLLIGPSAPELHGLRWEMLRDPTDNNPLSTSENLLFSRYLHSLDWRPVSLRAKGDLSALVVVANPADLANFNLAAVDVHGEIERAETGLGDILVSSLPEPEGNQYATLDNLLVWLRESEPDILYLVGHGILAKDEPWLWLEDENGNAARVSGTELVIRLRELVERPRLVVLASCESAGDGTGETLAALGPRLAEAGIPAVLAMQGKISLQTVAEFMPVFFRELSHDGQIDRALAVARGTVRQQSDHWMLALYMRLKSGRIWYVPGFGEERDEFEKWESLVGSIQDKTCTPIIGPGLIEALLGSRREMALRWAEKHGYPMSPHDRDVLPRVAQYVLTQQSPAYLSVALREGLRDEILRRYQSELPDELVQSKTWSTPKLMQALKLASECCWSNDPADPYRMLAQLRLPIYITTSSLDLMTNELIEAGADPVVRICPWNKWIPKEKAIYEETPTVERPLVYHLFGHINIPNSMVYSDDRYFDYLIGVTLNKSLIPSAVRAALNSSSLLFLGFQMDDLEFRVFFRFLLAQEGREMLKFYSHVAAQIEPEEDRIVDVKRARKYLAEYYESENIEIYWGSTKEFLQSLWQHM
jgi:hypothetical protein